MDAIARTYTVEGMSCGHCEASVSEQVERIPGVTGAEADRRRGTLVVGGAGFSDDAVRDAVDEAGYELVGGPR